MVSIQRDQKSPEVGNVLTQRLPSIDVKSGENFVAVELIRQLPGPLLEMRGIG